MASVERIISMSSARRLARMRGLFATERAVLVEDYEHFTQVSIVGADPGCRQSPE